MGGYEEELLTISLPAIVKLKMTNKADYSIQSLFDIAGQKLRERAIKRVSNASCQEPPCLWIELE